MGPKRIPAVAVSIVCAVMVCAPGLSAQPASRFEVASVKPNTSGDFERVELAVGPGGRFTAVNVPLQELVQLAHGVSDFQVVDAPGWIRGARFDIDARASSELTPGTVPPQLRQLLIDRFHLAAHRDTREMPIYRLVLARSDRRLGPSLTHAASDGCAEAPRGRGPSPPSGQRRRCVFRIGNGSLIAASMSMATLASRLKALVGRFVDDETGLDGLYDFEMKWLPPDGASAATDPGAPAIFTALQEQLGLRLEASRAPVDVLVVDHIERSDAD
jgi:uncharacterized protein (TIGR03435 family)